LKTSKNHSQENMTPENVFKLIKEPNNESSCKILDVRTPWEFSKEHIESAENLDCTDPDFKEQLLKLDRKQKYIVYCKSGVRGAKVLDLMKKNGFINVYNMKGGLEDWKKGKLPTENR
jgi:rhodanese-related sulfurtransferase